MTTGNDPGRRNVGGTPYTTPGGTSASQPASQPAGKPAGMSQTTKAIIIAAVVLFVVLAPILTGVANKMLTPADIPVPTDEVGDFFVDINGDGLLDYIVKAVVVFNTGGEPKAEQPFTGIPTPDVYNQPAQPPNQ